MSNATTNTVLDPGKPSITNDKSGDTTNVQSENEGRGDTSKSKQSGYEQSFFFVFIAVIVLAATMLWIHDQYKRDRFKYQYQDGSLNYKKIMISLMYILIIVLCTIIILRRGAVHWAFKIAILVPFGYVLVGLGYFLFIIWILSHLK